VILALAATIPAPASADGLAADELVITVGYFGGPYYEKAVFTAADLWGLDVQYVSYTMIDNMPSVVITHAAGVTLHDLMDAAGIDLGSIQSFNFWTNDKEGGYYNSMTKAFLIDTPRYLYYSLPDNFDYDEGHGNDYATLDSVRVPTMIALADDWRRSLAGASFGSDFQNLDATVRFRLVYGQTDTVTRTASDSAKWIHRIEVTLGGAPTLTIDASVLDLEVGSRHRTEARINAADPVIAANAEITWSSSDEWIATVDADGEITIHSEGSATISAQWGEQSASMVVTGTAAAEESDQWPSVMQGTEDSGEDGGGSGEESGEESFGTGDSGVENGESSVESEETASPDPDVSDSTEDPVMPNEPDGVTLLQPAAEPTAVLLGRELSIISSSAADSPSDDGGVQNWRREEMAQTAVELPVIPPDVQTTYVFIAISLFFTGGIFQYARYKFS